jgi:polyisoprenoid-binding protein YceI
MRTPTLTPRSVPAPVACALAVALSLGAATSAGAQEYHVDRSADRKVTFTSRASSLEFEGVTDGIDGYVLLAEKRLSPDASGDATELYFEVDLSGLDTGIGMRNRHMRDNYLEVGKYPYATYKGRIERVAPSSAGGFKVTASGSLTIHGVSHDREIACDVSPEGSGYEAHCAFDVLLSDYDIEIPKIMFLKLANEIQLALDFSVMPAEGSHP